MVIGQKIMAFLLLFCIVTGTAAACDPNFQTVEMLNLQLEPLFYPGLLPLFAEMFTNKAIKLPKTWESVSIIGARTDSYLGELDKQFFLICMNGAVELAHSLQDNLVGRLIIRSLPIRLLVSRNGLTNEGWQTVVINLIIPVFSRMVIYEPGVAISFIDELDTSINLSIISSWPPALIKHIRVWNNQGMIYSWPEEDISY